MHISVSCHRPPRSRPQGLSLSCKSQELGKQGRPPSKPAGDAHRGGCGLRDLEATEVCKEAGGEQTGMPPRGSRDHWLGWESTVRRGDQRELNPRLPGGANTAARFPVTATGTPKGKSQPWEDEVAAGCL